MFDDVTMSTGSRSPITRSGTPCLARRQTPHIFVRARAAWPVLACVALLAACSPPRPEPPEDAAHARSAGATVATTDGRVRLAVTLDDLPLSGPSAGAAALREDNARIIQALRQRGIPAHGFVNCANVRGDTAVLRDWLAAGFGLGNHTARHLALDQAGARRWLADVRACDATLRVITGQAPQYFRYPMLRQGATASRRDSAAEGLAEMGYVTAHVTVDNSEHLLALGYRAAATANDSAGMAAIATLYFEHLRNMLRHARSVAHRKLGRDVSHVLLLHVNELNADHLGAVLDSLALDGAEFVSLPAALRDPVYSLADLYVGPRGLSWLYRIAPLDSADLAWDDAEADRIDSALAAIANRRDRSGTVARTPRARRAGPPRDRPEGFGRDPAA